jgi:predicted dehydrogenase
MSNEFSRRDFLGIGAATAAGALIVGCGTGDKTASVQKPAWMDKAPDGKPLKAGLIGCGGRGRGAVQNFLDAGPNLTVVAVADVFQDRVDEVVDLLKKEKDIELSREQQFVGFDAYKKVLESEADYIILATPPHFRPEHFAAAVEARKNIFTEKPLAVDPVGIRTILAASKRADTLGLCVGTGTQRHHQRDYVECLEYIKAGAIGDIVSANAYWNMRQLWYRSRKPDWSDMEYMIRDWVNWCWLSGDHIVEQHVHNLDVINWFTGGMHPVKAVGFGSRHRRVTGDQYDNFSVDYVYENGVHMHSMCRQIDGCVNNVSEWIVGTEGVSNCKNMIKKHDGTVVWQYQYPPDENGQPGNSVKVSPYVQEHIDLVAAIRAGKQVNETELTAISTMTAIMGRISAYTGKEVTWDEMMSSDLYLGPNEYRMGKYDIVKNEGKAPVPGEASEES